MPRKFPCLVAFECPGCLVKGKGQTVNGRDFHWNAYRPHNAETSVILVGLQRFSATQVSSRSKAPVVQPFECPVPGLTAGFDKVAGVEQRCKGLGGMKRQCPMPARPNEKLICRTGGSNVQYRTPNRKKQETKFEIGRWTFGVGYFFLPDNSNIQCRTSNNECQSPCSVNFSAPTHPFSL